MTVLLHAAEVFSRKSQNLLGLLYKQLRFYTATKHHTLVCIDATRCVGRG